MNVSAHEMGGRAAAEGLVGGDQDRALRHAEFQVLHVGHFGDRVLGVGNVPEVRIDPRQHAEAGLGGVAVEQFGGGAVGSGHDFVKVGEQIGKGQQPEFLFEGHKVGDAGHRQGEGALLHVAEAFAFVAERAAVEALYLNVALGLFFDVLLEAAPGDAHFRVFRVTGGDFQGQARLGGESGTGGHKTRHKEKGQEPFHIHNELVMLWCSREKRRSFLIHQYPGLRGNVIVSISGIKPCKVFFTQ